MTIEEVKEKAFAMPITNPAYNKADIRFVNREMIIIAYKTDIEILKKIVPEPLLPASDIVLYEWIRMPDSSGLGSYMESGQVIPVTYKGKPGSYTHSMYLDNLPGIIAGREVMGFPKVWGTPRLDLRDECFVGALDYSGVRVATGTMAYKQSELPLEIVSKGFETPNFVLKSIPHVDGTPRILELVRFSPINVKVKGAWAGSASLELHPHCMAPVSQLPVKEVVGGTHILADMTLTAGEVVHDYLADE
ncbi:MAG: acetoacetate decarboxylase [Flavobacteriaceae bacterium]|nr:acetoacetate decarboxylase [Flavobacteriaceae bacterium]